MLSSVSIVCSGMCAGIWVISGIFIFGCKSRYFIPVSLIVILLYVFFFFFAYFANVVNSSMWTGLQAAVPQGDDVLFSPADSLPDVALASRAPSTSSKYSSSYNGWKSWV